MDFINRWWSEPFLVFSGVNPLVKPRQEKARRAERRAIGVVTKLGLESETSSELTGERPRQQAARGIDEPERLLKTRPPGDTAEVIAVIGMVRQVERLECELQVAAFSHLEVLSHARVHVKVGIATKRVERRQVTVPSVVTLDRGQLPSRDHRAQVVRIVVRHYERCRGAAATKIQQIGVGNRKIWPRRSRLKNGRELHAPRQV